MERFCPCSFPITSNRTSRAIQEKDGRALPGAPEGATEQGQEHARQRSRQVGAYRALPPRSWMGSQTQNISTRPGLEQLSGLTFLLSPRKGRTSGETLLAQGHTASVWLAELDGERRAPATPPALCTYSPARAWQSYSGKACHLG